MAQKIVNKKLAFGIEGEFYDSSLKRAVNRKLGTDARFGKVVFIGSDGTVTPTYNSSTASVIAGIVVNPKEYINNDANLGATLVAKGGRTVGVADIGRVIVRAANSVKIGDKVFTCVTKGTGTGETVNYNIGDLCGGTAAPASTAGGGGVFVEVTGAMFDIVKAGAGELAVVTLNK